MTSARRRFLAFCPAAVHLPRFEAGFEAALENSARDAPLGCASVEFLRRVWDISLEISLESLELLACLRLVAVAEAFRMLPNIFAK